MKPSHIVTVSSPSDKRYLSSPPDLRADHYTLIRLIDVADWSLLETLDTTIGTINEVPNIEELSDGSLEICVLKSYRFTAQGKLGKIFPDSDIELYYNPLEPTAKDVEVWSYDQAKKLHLQWLFERSLRIVSKGWPAAAAFYFDLLRVMCGLAEAAVGFMNSYSFKHPLVPTYRGHIRTKEDAVYLLEACLREELSHSCRGPRKGDSVISGDVFVWETNSTGIHHWSDGLEWTAQTQNDFEVSKAMDETGLMKKTIRIPACRAVHNVVSYYEERDTWLSRRSMAVRPS